MGRFLNSRMPYADFQEMVSDCFFVDKSALITELIPALGKKNRYFCITRPRRFGKSVMANMVAAFFGKADDASGLFCNLSIGSDQHYQEHLNRHHVIYIDFSRTPENCDSYRGYIERITNGLKKDLLDAYPELALDPSEAVWDILKEIFEKTLDKFIFVMDEWDAIFHKPFIRDQDKTAYLAFLRNLLKGQTFVELAYMTGILPIAKYSSGSELNMFLEYDMATKKKFSEYFGFLDEEVDRLFQIYQQESAAPAVTREDLRNWYDGYCISGGKRIYNPRSVVCALADNQISNYWTNSGPYDEIFYYIKHNIDDVKDDLALMVSGECVKIRLQGYAATAEELNTRDQIYSAMVVYGLLTYDEETGRVYIPNKELMEKFHELLLSNESLGYVYRLAKESDRMLEATLEGDTKTMAELLQYVHNTESPILTYNHEVELSAVVNLIYLAARDKYRVEREDKAGKGYVDFIFYPEKRGADAIIIELKVDSTPEEAISQIKKKDYALRFKGRLGEKVSDIGRVLAVGISYDRTTKEHDCKIEELEL